MTLLIDVRLNISDGTINRNLVSEISGVFLISESVLVLITLTKSLISPHISTVMSLTGLLFDMTITSIENLLLLTHLNQTIIALNPTSIFQSL